MSAIEIIGKRHSYRGKYKSVPKKLSFKKEFGISAVNVLSLWYRHRSKQLDFED